MKKALSIFGQFVLFFVVFLAGSLFTPFKMKWFISHPTVTSTRFWTPDGLLLMVVVLVLVLGLAAARKRLMQGAPLTLIAFVLALLLGVVSKFGWATHDLF